MKFIDTHAHLSAYHELYDEISHESSHVLQFIINISVCKSNWIFGYEIAQKYPNIFYAIGIHPLYINSHTLEDLHDMKIKDKCIAIGEIGLDCYRNDDFYDMQKKFFIAQAKFAQDSNLPMILHVRGERAYKDIAEIILHDFADQRILFHSYSSNDYTDDMIYKHSNMCVGYNGIITFKNCSKRDIHFLQSVNINQVFSETDAPYLTPEPLRGSKNYPKNTKYIVKKMSSIMGVDIHILQKSIYNNFIKFFDIPS